MSLIDAIGQEHTSIAASKGPPRIISLVPSISELLCDLGLAHWLVGRTGFCIHPADQVRAIAKVGGTKDVNIEKIRSLAPTHVIVNIDENEKPAIVKLAQFVPHIIVTHPLTARDNLALYRLLGGIFAVEAEAQRLCAAFEQEYAALAALASRPKKKVMYCIWRDPWMTVGRNTYIADMLSHIGWMQCAMAGVPDTVRYPQFTWGEALPDIDLVLLSSEPYRFTETHVDELRQQLDKPVRLIDGEMVSWYGSRAIAGLRYLKTLQGLV